MHTDHLGSVDVVTSEGVANDPGTELERVSFTAFGQYRGVDWGDSLLSQLQLATVETTRGFTGHEQLADVGLIHMNGRAYDPLLGRFISADPQIQFVSNLQSYNRYSYVHNNPLSYTDPSGYGVSLKFKKFMRKNVDTIFMVAAIATGSPAAVATMAAFLAGKNGASTKEAIKAGIIAGLTTQAFTGVGAATAGLTGWEIAIKMVSHGMVGGISSEIQGGTFNDGFITAGLSAGAAPYAGNVVKAALIGGAISSLNGGKFATGAVTSAMGYAFNEAKHGMQGRARKALNELRKYPEFAGYEKNSVNGRFSLTTDASAVTGYDPNTNTININPDIENLQYTTTLPDDWVDDYPGTYAFSLKRGVYHEAYHSTQDPSGLRYMMNADHIESLTIKATNKFMWDNFREPLRAPNHRNWQRIPGR